MNTRRSGSKLVSKLGMLVAAGKKLPKRSMLSPLGMKEKERPSASMRASYTCSNRVLSVSGRPFSHQPM